MKLRCLNLGCGARFHPDWTNLDLKPSSPVVSRWDLGKQLPYPPASFDVVYHSHVLEHFSKEDGRRLLQECWRVLRAGGIVRVAVPDLEQIARLYLEALDKSVAGDRTWQDRYNWMLLEMYDQTVRERSGGEMLAYLNRDPMPEQDFVMSRIGGELLRARSPKSSGPPEEANSQRRSFLKAAKRKMVRLGLGSEGMREREVGAFRFSGEIHRWMYDRYSLARALEDAGFSSPRKMDAAESTVPGWMEFHLDTEPDGSVYKPDSLFMEATRP